MALYHTHRPQTFGTITGQTHIVRTLENQVKKDTVAHAYLLSGPRGTGKTTSARILAKAINCTERKDGEAEPCNTCLSCTQITTGNSLDVIEIDAASHTGVDHVREHIIDNAQFRPTTAKYKVFIIDEVHMLSTSAFNALLKTLEEPPKHCVFVLATTELHKIPDTIISRCQRFQFGKVSYTDMRAHLLSVMEKEQITADDDIIDRVIGKSDGCVRDAMSILDQLLAIGERHLTREVAEMSLPSGAADDALALLTALLEKNAKTGLETVGTMAERGVPVLHCFDEMITLIRAIIITQATGVLPLDTMIKKSAEDIVRSYAKKQDVRTLLSLADVLQRRRNEVKNTPLPTFPLELAIAEWCYPEASSAVLKPNTPPIPHTAPVAPPKETPTAKTVSPTKALVADTITEAIPEQAHTNTTLTLTKELALSYWQALKKEFETASPSLVTIMAAGVVSRADGNLIELEVPFGFHKDKLLVKTTKHLIDQKLGVIAGGHVVLDIVVKKTEESTGPAIDTDIQNLANAFGGTIG